MCIKLVNYWDKYTEMHGQQNVNICDAKQAKEVNQYKNTKIKLYKSNAAIWYNKTCMIKQLWVLSRPVHETATYRCDDIRGCVMQFWPPGDEHMCSKHVEAWNKLTVKQKFCASSWLITEINKEFNYVTLNVNTSYCSPIPIRSSVFRHVTFAVVQGLLYIIPVLIIQCVTELLKSG